MAIPRMFREAVVDPFEDGDAVPMPLGFIAFPPEWLSQRGGLHRLVSSRHPGWRSGRMPAEPYPPPRQHQINRISLAPRNTDLFCTYYGPEFRGRALQAWSEQRNITLAFIEPGKPIQNAVVESFNGRMRDECLNANWFLNVADARRKVLTWRQDYNKQRPHSALGYRTPSEYAASKKVDFNPETYIPNGS